MPWTGLVDPAAALAFLVLAAPFVGSFIATVAIRDEAGEGWIRGRSRCRSCARPLRGLDLIPLFGWLAARGRCRGCGALVSALYPGLEAAALSLSATAAVLLAPGNALIGIPLGWALLLLATLDWRQFILPDALTLPLLAAGLALAWFEDRLDGALIGALGAAAAFAGIAAAYRRWRGREGLGDGDIRLIAAIGAWLGWQALAWVVLIACIAALAVGLLRRQPLRAASRLPFGAYLAGAFWLVWLGAAALPLP